MDGDKLKNLREGLELSHAALADAANKRIPAGAPPITKDMIRNIERGLSSNPGYWCVVGLAKALKVKEKDLYRVEVES